jgi:carbon monoxide dehydrogenase subunit G
MRLEHSFTVPVPVASAWAVLLDLPRIAPCMPGATVTSVQDDRFTGTVKVKLGPIALTYQGKGRFVERDEAARRMVVEASGKDIRSAGTAAATVTATLAADGDRTAVQVITDLTVTGRPAQFGRGMLADVSGRLVDQFAGSLAKELAGDVVAGPPAPVERVERVEQEKQVEEVEPIDLLHVSGIGLVARRAAPYLVSFLAGGLLVWLLGRRRRRTGRRG